MKMGRNSGGGGGARGATGSAGGSSSSSSSASSVSASVAGYADLTTPTGVKISPAGQISLKAPKTVEQANKMLTVVDKAHSIAQAEAKATEGLPRNSPAKVAASLRVLHTSQQLARVTKMAKNLTDK